MTDREQLIQEIEQAPDSLITELLNFLRTHKASSELVQAQPNQHDRPIWEFFEAAADDIPDDVLEQLPIDGAAHHDHYLYGTPKNG
jgi:hypothetical protein